MTAKVRFKGNIVRQATTQKFDQEGGIAVSLTVGFEAPSGEDGPDHSRQLVEFQKNGDVLVTIAPEKFTATVKRAATVTKLTEEGHEVLLQLALEVPEPPPKLVAHLVECQSTGTVGVAVEAVQLSLDTKAKKEKGGKKAAEAQPPLAI